MAEFTLVNPRRRKRRRTARRKRATSKRRRRRRINPYMLMNARRRRSRRRVGTRRRRRSGRRRINPRGFKLPGIAGVNLMDAGLGVVGMVGSNVAAGFLTKMLPAQWSTGQAAPLVRLGAKAAIAVGVPMLLGRVIGRSAARALTYGVVFSILHDVYTTWIAPAIGLSDYELGAFTYGALPSLETDQMSGLSTDGMYEGSLYS